jgi:hypothetical protein
VQNIPQECPYQKHHHASKNTEAQHEESTGLTFSPRISISVQRQLLTRSVEETNAERKNKLQQID